MENKLKDNIQSKALQTLKNNNYTGTVVLDMGTGKTLLAIKAIREGRFKNILITSPRTNLIESWLKELQKWNINIQENGTFIDGLLNSTLNITINNIQTTYKYSYDTLKSFDLIIADELHLIASPEYSKLIINSRKLNIPVIGLTGTPSLDNEYKNTFYKSHLPIVFEYYDSAKDGLINKKKFYIYKYELTDDYKIITGSKNKKWFVGEKKQYTYLSEQIKKGQYMMSRTGSTNWFNDAAQWFWNKQGSKEQKEAARIYLNAIKYRKEFLWNLTSSAEIANNIKSKVLSNPNNKVLLFSELTSQAEKLSNYSVHSNNPDDFNKNLIQQFDNNAIRELSAVRTLSLGLNLKDANWAIFESYNGSGTDFSQKAGRLHRLQSEDIAFAILIVPINTQAEQWANSLTNTLDEYIEVFDIKDIIV